MIVYVIQRILNGIHDDPEVYASMTKADMRYFDLLEQCYGERPASFELAEELVNEARNGWEVYHWEADIKI